MVLSFAALCAVIWIVILAAGEGKPVWENPLGRWMAIRTDGFDLRNLLTYQFLHENLIHLIVNVAVIVYAGRRLELAWGPARFASFSAASGILCGLAVYGVDLAFRSAGEPWQPSVSFGASGIAFACLAASMLASEDRPVIGFFTERYLLWSAMILGAGGLVLLEQAGRGEPPHLRLTPQLSGIALGIALFYPAAAWKLRSHRREVRRRQQGQENAVDIRLRVDQILEKISRNGMGSLSEEERVFLRDASKHFRNRL